MLVKHEDNVELVRVEYGKWIESWYWMQQSDNPKRVYQCSKCRKLSKTTTNYCHNCGARMENTADLISRQAAEAALVFAKGTGDIKCKDMRVIIDTLRSVPSANVRPVVRGKWVVSRTDYGWNCAEYPTHCRCSECGREVLYQDKDNFCPKCGVNMELEE